MYTSAQTGKDPVKLQSKYKADEGQQQAFLFTLCGFDLSASWLDWGKKRLQDHLFFKVHWN